jgi:hypothetical protein
MIVRRFSVRTFSPETGAVSLVMLGDEPVRDLFGFGAIAID